MAVSEDLRELNMPRMRRKYARRHALDLAHANAVDAIFRLLAGDTPEWFTAEQEDAYTTELRRLCDTIGGPSLARARA
jgi:hypothetical protein